LKCDIPYSAVHDYQIEDWHIDKWYFYYLLNFTMLTAAE